MKYIPIKDLDAISAHDFALTAWWLAAAIVLLIAIMALVE